MQNIIDRFFMIMEFKNWKQKDLAHALKIAPASVSLLFKNQTNPSFDSISNLLKSVPELSASWLINGAGNMLAANDDAGCVPILGEIAAGQPVEFVPFPEIVSVPLPFECQAPEHYHALKVFGDSMSPHIIHNDVVIIHTVFDPWDLDGKVVACKIDTETTLKCLLIDHDHHQSILLPYNTRHYKPIVLDENSPFCQIIGYMVAIIRYA